MKSKANFKSHPIHPILVAFPIAFFTGTLIFDLLSLFNENQTFAATARYLIWCGIISGLVAAIPGLIDYNYTVPPNSSAKSRAVKHGLLNTSVIILFVINLLLRNNASVSFLWMLALDIVAVVLLVISGFLGGTLVYRNQIGVDIRYANAGKWKEMKTDAGGGRIEVGAENELSLNQMKLLRIRGRRIVLARSEEGFAAFSDHCTHRGGSLAGGSMICGKVQCPWHGSQFDVRDGSVCAGPAKEKIETFATEVSNGKVFLLLP